MLGKLGDWRIPMGPYTPPQLAVASIGAFLLIKTATWWAPLTGPVPVVAWGFGIWAARHSRIAGRSPFPALLDALSLAVSPRPGRIGGRAVREPRPAWLTGGFGIEEAADDTDGAQALPSPSAEPATRSERTPSLTGTGPKHPSAPAPSAPARGPALTPLQQMLAAAAAARTDTTDHQADTGDQR